MSCGEGDESTFAPHADSIAEEGQALFGGGNYWAKRTARVCYLNATSSDATLKGLLRQALKDSWEAHSGFSFTGFSSCTAADFTAATIRVRFEDGGWGGWSQVGPRVSGQSPDGATLMISRGTYNSTNTAELTGVVVHEFGHAIGWQHEQQRSDTPRWCLDEQGGSVDVIAGGSFLTPWDATSIMNYCQGDLPYPHLSAGDIAGSRLVYGTEAKPQVTVSGRVTLDGKGLAGVKIDTCTGAYPVSDAQGNYAFGAKSGQGFCARVASGTSGSWMGPSTHNNPAHATSRTYESQVAGVDCRGSCAGTPGSWDRPVDNGYDFRFLTGKSAGIVATPTGEGYWLFSSNGGVFTFGDADFFGSAFGKTTSPFVAMAATSTGRGYWLLAQDGGVFTFGDATFKGSGFGKVAFGARGIARTSTNAGYWVVDAIGQVFAFGDAKHAGDAVGKLNGIVTGIAGKGTGGYWLIAQDGGVFTFGTASFFGSASGSTKSAVGIAIDFVHAGYWVAASDGGVFSLGTAFQGSMGGQPLLGPVVGLASRPQGDGYWLTASDGAVFSFGAARYYGRN